MFACNYDVPYAVTYGLFRCTSYITHANPVQNQSFGEVSLQQCCKNLVGCGVTAPT